MQEYLNAVGACTNENLMVLNAVNSKYMIFNTAMADFNTRLTINNTNLDQVSEARVLGVILTDDMKFEKNTADICKRAFARLSMITKLKYVGVKPEDLIQIFTLYIRSLLEYCCVSWHSSLTQELTDDIERVPRPAMKVILGPDYTDYNSSLETCGLETLFARRERRCLNFGLRAIDHPKLKSMFPLNDQPDAHTRKRNTFEVNFARTSRYKNSAIPHIQNLLNDHFEEIKKNKKPK